LRLLLTRIRQGVQDQSDADLLMAGVMQKAGGIPWESGITVVTPLNRNRWNLNIGGTLSFQRRHQAPLRIFMSEHKWKDGQPTEEEALVILNYGDDSSVPVPAVFMFVDGLERSRDAMRRKEFQAKVTYKPRDFSFRFCLGARQEAFRHFVARGIMISTKPMWP
jgi:hypothetical protein